MTHFLAWKDFSYSDPEYTKMEMFQLFFIFVQLMPIQKSPFKNIVSFFA